MKRYSTRSRALELEPYYRKKIFGTPIFSGESSYPLYMQSVYSKPQRKGNRMTMCGSTLSRIEALILRKVQFRKFLSHQNKTIFIYTTLQKLISPLNIRNVFLSSSKIQIDLFLWSINLLWPVSEPVELNMNVCIKIQKYKKLKING